jgi:hypothetical protein
MQIIRQRISLEELKKKIFEGFVKAVVDVDQQIMAVGIELHADGEFLLLENGSGHLNLWGIKLFPDKAGTDGFVVFDSMTNFRPSWGNKTRGVDDPIVQQRIRDIVIKLVIS